MEVELKSKQIEERVRSERVQGPKTDINKEAFLHQQQAKVLEYLGDTSHVKDITSPTLDAMRERIALMALNLYEYSPPSAVNFLINMIQNVNPLIRMNVVLALVYIAKKDTLDMLITLYEDDDPRVKREVIKNMKKILQKISTGELNIDEESKNKINKIVQEERTKGEWIL
jgi:HEAT repeat protein